MDKTLLCEDEERSLSSAGRGAYSIAKAVPIHIWYELDVFQKRSKAAIPTLHFLYTYQIAVEAPICCDRTLYFNGSNIQQKSTAICYPLLLRSCHAERGIEEDLIIITMRDCPLETPVSPLTVGSMRWLGRVYANLSAVIPSRPIKHGLNNSKFHPGKR